MLKSTAKDIAKSVKSLLILLQSMRGQRVVITLRNDSLVTGTIIRVDADMNIELEDATMEPDPFYITTNVQTDTIVETPTPERLQDDEPHDEDDAVSEPDGGQYRYLVIKGSRVRHLDVPEDCDLVQAAKHEIERIRNRHKQWSKRDIVRS